MLATFFVGSLILVRKTRQYEEDSGISTLLSVGYISLVKRFCLKLPFTQLSKTCQLCAFPLFAQMPWRWLQFGFFFFFSCFLGPHLWLMEFPRLGIQLELHMPAYTTATAISDPNHVCNLHHSSRQHWILHLLSKARDWTCNLMVPSRIHFHCSTTGILLFASWFRVFRDNNNRNLALASGVIGTGFSTWL